MTRSESTARNSPSIAIIGAGISGLAAALRVLEIEPHAKLTVFESADEVGGVLRTEQADGFLIELSADTFITDQPAALDFCGKLALELIPTNAAQRKAYIAFGNRLEAVPEGFLLMAPSSMRAIWSTPLLSLNGKLRLAAERFIPPRPAIDPVAEPQLEESLAQFAARRLGREGFERLVQPLVSGIYSAEADKLSLAATLPRFIAMEREHGSLTAAMRYRGRDPQKNAPNDDSGARYSLFMAPKHGMSALAESAASKLPNDALRLSTQVDSIEQRGGQWQVEVAGQGNVESFDHLIVATPAPVAAKLLTSVDEELASAIASIPMGGCSVVCLGYRRDAMAEIPQGFGFVVPAIEGRPLLAASYSSEKFSERAARDHFLVRAFIGGPGKEKLAALSDEELVGIAEQELTDLLKIQGAPLLHRVARWHGMMPQYHVGHLALVDRIETLVGKHTGLAIAGNAYRGVGIPQCIKSGEAAAEQILGAASR